MQPVTGTSADDARTKTQEKASEKTSTAGTPGPTPETHAPPTPHAVRPETSKVPVTDDERAVASAAERKALQRARIASAPGFVAALDQSGGSTPRALALYGITDIREKDKARMFGVMHDMRSRIITCDAFDGEKIIGAILFEDTVFERQVLGLPTATYLWDVKNVVPFIKIDKGLEKEADGVQLMRPIPDLAHTLAKCGCFHEPYDPHDTRPGTTTRASCPPPWTPFTSTTAKSSTRTPRTTTSRAFSTDSPNAPSRTCLTTTLSPPAWTTAWCARRSRRTTV
jgi:fructose-bisphosphate aldolase class I